MLTFRVISRKLEEEWLSKNKKYFFPKKCILTRKCSITEMSVLKTNIFGGNGALDGHLASCEVI